MTTGLTLALSVGPVLAAIGIVIPIASICLLVWAASLGAIYASKSALRLVRIGWLVSAGLIGVAIAMYTAVGGGTSWLVNTILVGCAVSLIAAALRIAPEAKGELKPLGVAPQPAE